MVTTGVVYSRCTSEALFMDVGASPTAQWVGWMDLADLRRERINQRILHP